MTYHSAISVFQPIGDAASELRAIVPGIDHLTAVSVLQEAEMYGMVTDQNEITVTFNESTYKWEVWTSDVE